jgi:hypothetical protein
MSKKTKSNSTRSKPKWSDLIWVDTPDLASVYRLRDFDEDEHRILRGDIIEHIPSVNCPCNPTTDPCSEAKFLRGVATSILWIHRDLMEEPH